MQRSTQRGTITAGLYAALSIAMLGLVLLAYLGVVAALSAA